MNGRRLAALIVLPAALALGACTSSSSTPGNGTTASNSGGGSSSTPAGGGATPTDAAGLATRMLNAVAGISSAHITLNVDASGQSLTGAGDEKLSGGKLVALRLTETLPSKVGGDIEVIIVNGKTYAKLPASLNKTGKPYILVSEKSTNPVIKELATSIDSALSSASIGSVGAFVKAAHSVDLRGSQTVDGVHTTHYAVVVDIAKLPADLPGQSALASSGLKTLPLDLYLDGLGRPVQVTENLTLQGQSISTVVKVSGYNKPVSISAPPANQVAAG